MLAQDLVDYALMKIYGNHVVEQKGVLAFLENGSQVKGYIIGLRIRNNLGELQANLDMLSFEEGETMPSAALMGMSHDAIVKLEDCEFKSD